MLHALHLKMQYVDSVVQVRRVLHALRLEILMFVADYPDFITAPKLKLMYASRIRVPHADDAVRSLL